VSLETFYQDLEINDIEDKIRALERQLQKHHNASIEQNKYLKQLECEFCNKMTEASKKFQAKKWQNIYKQMDQNKNINGNISSIDIHLEFDSEVYNPYDKNVLDIGDDDE